MLVGRCAMADNANSRSNAPRVSLDKRRAEAPSSLTAPPPAPVGRPALQSSTPRRGPRAPLLLGSATVGLLVIVLAGWLLVGSDHGTKDRSATAEEGSSTQGVKEEVVDDSDPASPSDSSSTVAFEAFSGSWSGVVSQFDDGPQVDFPMTLTLSADKGGLTGSTSYDLRDGVCRGELEFVSGDASVVDLRERISNGHCVGSGDISVRYLTDSSVSFEYRATKRSGATQVVRGVLTR